jgi:hypothetical protein
MSDSDKEGKEEGELEEGELSEEPGSEPLTKKNDSAEDRDSGDDDDSSAREGGRSGRKRKRSGARSEDEEDSDGEKVTRVKEKLDEFGRVIQVGRVVLEKPQDKSEKSGESPSKRHTDRSDRPPGQRVRYSDRAMRAAGTQTDLVGSEIERESRASERSEALEHEVGKQRLELQILNQKLLEAGRQWQVAQGQREADERAWQSEKEGMLAMKAQLVNQVAEMEVLLEDVQEQWTKVRGKGTAQATR